LATDRLPAIAAILMVVRASAFENVTAEFVLRLLRARGRHGVEVVFTCLRWSRAQIPTMHRRSGGTGD